MPRDDIKFIIETVYKHKKEEERRECLKKLLLYAINKDLYSFKD